MTKIDPNSEVPPIKQRLGEEKPWEGKKCEMHRCMNDNEAEAVNTINGTPCCQRCWDGYMDYLSRDYY